ncbi:MULTISPECIES: hypothetical protein [Nocardiopsidaceae]|uniref:TROVE domain-containing protein n=1 Tax=Streptomonospora nanhaiensis TaxID=1323731 RepID=A0ABY6YUL5_9ACTN|nr:hypothetical protein [Streptomonospora nanhaiensis]WAE76029.1 hypothetical protein OUQ99_13530 [Streptomonospora nanhaiensis]
MTDTYADLLACEDLLLFASAAISSTGQREFHSGAAEQRLSLEFLHEYVHGTHPDLYALALALHVNDHNAAAIVHRLLSNPRTGASAGERARENALIRRRLAEMPPQRVYRLFARLARERVNNRRTRATMRAWIAARPNLDLDAVKYRPGLRAAARHARVALPEEVGVFLFSPPGERRRHRYGSPLLRAHGRAHYSASDLYDLPYTVAEGFAARHRVPRGVFLEGVRERATRAERLRLAGTARRHGVGAGPDPAAAPLLRLCVYVLSLPTAERRDRRAELEGALAASALRAAGPAAGTWPRTAAVLDDSYSSIGSPVRRHHPLAAALACHHLIRALAPDSTSHWVSGHTDPLTVRPAGPTHLAERILDALDTGPARVVVVSDGHDSTPPLLADTLTLWRRYVDPDRATAMVHLNPVFDADGLGMRPLSPAVPTIGLRDPRTLPSLVELARFGEGRLGLSDLREHLRATADAYLEAP